MPWLFPIYSVALCLLAILGRGDLQSAAGIGMLIAMATWVTWRSRIPPRLQSFFTHPIPAVILDLALVWLGWTAFGGSELGKTSFVAWHVWFSLFLLWEYHRLLWTLCADRDWRDPSPGTTRDRRTGVRTSAIPGRAGTRSPSSRRACRKPDE